MRCSMCIYWKSNSSYEQPVCCYPNVLELAPECEYDDVQECPASGGSKRVVFKIDEKLSDDFDRQALAQNRSRSSLLELLMASYLKEVHNVYEV